MRNIDQNASHMGEVAATLREEFESNPESRSTLNISSLVLDPGNEEKAMESVAMARLNGVLVLYTPRIRAGATVWSHLRIEGPVGAVLWLTEELHGTI